MRRLLDVQIFTIPAKREMNTSAIGFREKRCGLMLLCSGILIAVLLFVTGVKGLGPLDDHQMQRTIFLGKDFEFYVMPALGRFFPLAAQEYVLLAKIFGPSPELFYLFNALKLIPCGFLLYLCLTATGARNVTVFVLWWVTLLSMGTASTLFRLSAPELNLLILMLLLTWSSLKVLNGDAAKQQNTGSFVALGLCAFFLGLFYKELTFVFGAVFGAAEWLRYRRARKERPPALVYALILLSSLYITGYFLWRLLYVTGSYSSFHSLSITQVLPLFASSDPFLLFVVMPLTGYRLVVVAVAPGRHVIHDSFLLAACAYACAYFVLSIFNWYYLLPAYAFAATGAAGVLRSMIPSVRSLTLLAITLCGLNVLPMAASDVQAQKNMADNHYSFVKFLAGWLKAHASAPPMPRALILAGVSPGGGVEILVSLKTFLLAFGVRDESIELRGSDPPDNAAISRANLIKHQGRHDENAAPGDLLIFNPYQKHMTPPPLHAPSIDEIYRSADEWVFPRWSVLEWISECVIDHQNCVASIERNRRYSGYAAFVVKRQGGYPAFVVGSQARIEPTVELVSPSYRSAAVLVPDRMERSTSQLATVWIENIGAETWPADGRLQPGRYVHLAYRWFDNDGRMILEGDRTPFPEPVQPGDKVKMALRIKSPKTPGMYRLVISPIQEEVQWFERDGVGKTVDIY
jgi:hypothetical protein